MTSHASPTTHGFDYMISCSIDPKKVLCQVFLADTHEQISKSWKTLSNAHCSCDVAGSFACAYPSVSRWNCTEILETLIRDAENTFLRHLQSKTHTLKSTIMSRILKKENAEKVVSLLLIQFFGFLTWFVPGWAGQNTKAHGSISTYEV